VASPLEGALRAQVYKGLRNLFLDATLTKDTPSSNSPDVDGFDPPAATPTDYPCKGMVEVYSNYDKAAGLVQTNDRKVLILADSISVTPRTGDRVTIRGVTFNVINVETDPAIAVWTCQGRF
jgi:hypothetical protein